MTLTLPPTFTEAHRRVLEWLPEDGSWREAFSMGPYLRDLMSSHEGTVRCRTQTGSATEWRLTPAGIDLVKKAKGK